MQCDSVSMELGSLVSSLERPQEGAVCHFEKGRLWLQISKLISSGLDYLHKVMI